MPISNEELEIMGYKKQYNYTQYSHDNHVNVIPEKDFKLLVQDTFTTINEILRETYGPYGSTMLMNTGNQNVSTKDGYNVFSAMGFNHQYKKIVYMAIQNICARVNQTVGDGTTSCMLLAGKIFNKLNEKWKTPDEKRMLHEALSEFESFCGSTKSISEGVDNGIIKPLNKKSLDSVIRMASNYDNKLTNVIIDALKPQYDQDDNVVSMRQIIVDKHLDQSISQTNYEVQYMPGQYRVNLTMAAVEEARLFIKPINVSIIMYDHNFTDVDWYDLSKTYEEYVKDENNKDRIVLVLAKSLNKTTFEKCYAPWVHKRQFTHLPCDIYLSTIKGHGLQTLIKDFAAVIKAKVHSIETSEVSNEELDNTIKMQIVNDNCLCVHDVQKPEVYIDKITSEMNAELDDSISKRIEYMNRIKSLSLNNQDSVITITSPSAVENKMIADKIDDCIHVIASALQNGVVPNVFRFGRFLCTESSFVTSDDSKNKVDKETKAIILNAINESFESLFFDIWESKYGKNDDDEINDFERGKRIYDKLNDSNNKSYDIVSDEIVDYDNFATSARYDIEVLNAAIDVVKYLTTSRGLIFDANIMQMHGDSGYYVSNN